MSRVLQARAQRTSLGWLSLKRQASASAGSCELAATSSMHLAPSAVEMATSTTPQHELECTRTRRRQGKRGRRGEAGRQCERETCNMPQARRTNCQHTHTQTHARAACLVVVVSCFQFSFSTQELPVRTRRLRVLVLVCVLALLLVCLWLRWCGP